MMKRLVSVGLATALLQACASYEPSSAPVPRPVPEENLTTSEGYGATSEGYAASVDPYLEPGRQEEVFSADFNEAGILAMQVVATNHSQQLAMVRRTDMFLVLPDGTRLAPITGHSAAVLVGEGGSVVGMTLAFGIIGGIAASGAEDTAREARIDDYEAKQFKDETLGPNQSTYGFVYFAPPEGTRPFNDATLEIRFVDSTTALGKVVSLPLKNLGFTGSSDSGSQAAAHRIQRLSYSCSDAKNPERPWEGYWRGTKDDATLTLDISEQSVRGDFDAHDRKYPISGTANDSGSIRAIIYSGPGFTGWTGRLDGTFPEVALSDVGGGPMGRKLVEYQGKVFRVCE